MEMWVTKNIRETKDHYWLRGSSMLAECCRRRLNRAISLARFFGEGQPFKALSSHPTFLVASRTSFLSLQQFVVGKALLEFVDEGNHRICPKNLLHARVFGTSDWTLKDRKFPTSVLDICGKPGATLSATSWSPSWAPPPHPMTSINKEVPQKPLGAALYFRTSW